MQLVKQQKLHLKDSKSDKIYEVDLYHIQGNEYIVNFRYGRRGSNLREGTKTVFPIQKEQADKVFEDLVASKTKKGYQEVQSYDDTIAQATPSPIVSLEVSGARAVVLAYLNKRAEGRILTTNWKLSRIIWRAGELEIEEAVPAIKSLLPNLLGQDIYAAVWALGRIANQEAVQALRSLPLDPQSLHFRIHLVALIAGGDKSAKDSIVNSLPLSIKTTYLAKSYAALKTELENSLSVKKSNADYLLSLYCLSIHDKALKEVIKEVLVDIDAVPGKWKYLRYIYKIAEMLKDGEVFGLIARIANLRKSFFNKSPWSQDVWLDGKAVNRVEALRSNEPRLAFSNKTRDYFIKRTLRRLRKAGVDKMESYCEMAAGILIAYRESDESVPFNLNSYSYDRTTRQHSTAVHTFPAMSRVPYFYYILFAQGDRMEIPGLLHKFYAVSELREQTSREDSFPELWDRYPEYAVKVLAKSKQRDAMNFGFKVLEGRPDLESLLTLEYLMTMISSPFEEVLEFSLTYLEKKYDPNAPQLELIFKLLEAKNSKATELVINLLDKNPEPFTDNIDFLKLAILSEHEEMHAWLRKNVQESRINESDRARVVDYCIDTFKTWDTTDYNVHPSETLVQIFPAHLKQLKADKIIALIDHPSLPIQLFGAKLINLNERKPEEWPDEILIKLITSEHAEIREEGMKLFSSLTDEHLLKKDKFIVQLASHTHKDLRLQARPIIDRLAKQNKEFGEAVLYGLYDVLLDTHEKEEIPIDVYDTIEAHLLAYTAILKPEIDEMLLSNNREIHFLTYHLLENEDLNSWPVGKVARFGAHDMNKIRAKAHKYFEENVDKVKYEKFEAINILDSDWEETRKYGRNYFDEHFTEKEWEPNLVIALCDNVRPETQAYGTRILGQYFKEEQGVKYLSALSEHPDPIIELYSTNYLNQYAFNNQSVLDKLKPYFIRTLSAINTRRVAKRRVFHFLEKQAKESESYAAYVTEIMNELVGTIVLQENENYVSLLHELKQKYPNLNINIEKVSLEIR